MATVGSSARYLLRRELAARRREQIYRLTMMRDAALAASLQVIEVRLRRIEEKDAGGSSLSDVLVDVAVAACFGVAGPVVVRGLRVLFDGVLRTRLAFALLPKSDLGLWFNNQLSNEAKRRFGNTHQALDTLYDQPFSPAARANLTDLLRPLVKTRGTEFDMFRKGFLNEQDPRLLFHSSTFAIVDGVVAAAPDAQTMSDTKELVRMAEKLVTPTAPAGVPANDMPAVRVLRAATEFFTRQIETQQKIFDDLDLELQTGGITAKEARLILPLVVDRDQPTTTGVAREIDIWARFFEHCIWIGLYPDIGQQRNRIEGVPQPLQDYLISRLYVRDAPDPQLGRPRTYLEQALHANKAAQQTVKAWTSSRGLKPIPEAEITANRGVAIRLLADDWREMVTELGTAQLRLYPRLQVPGVSPAGP